MEIDEKMDIVGGDNQPPSGDEPVLLLDQERDKYRMQTPAFTAGTAGSGDFEMLLKLFEFYLAENLIDMAKELLERSLLEQFDLFVGDGGERVELDALVLSDHGDVGRGLDRPMAGEGGDLAPDHAGRAIHPDICAGDLPAGQRRDHGGLSADPDALCAPHGQRALSGGVG